MPKACSEYLEDEISMYKKQIADIQKDIDTKIDNNTELTRTMDKNEYK